MSNTGIKQPQRLGPYRVLGMIAEGGMGVVYRALDLRSGHKVALKTVLVPEASHLDSIRREIHALSRVCHPGVVRILAQGIEQGRPWYAMELLEGQTLRKLSRRFTRATTVAYDDGFLDANRPDSTMLDVQQASRLAGRERDQLIEILNLVRRLCFTLSFLHGEGIVHRDLKPDNVILRHDGTPVLVDFGLVSRFAGPLGREQLEVPGIVIGSIEYMAPEQIQGELVDARTDLYALGCILYELIAGRPPFKGSPLSIASQHIHKTPAHLSDLVQDVPEALETLVLKLLAKSPRDRIGYADDVATTLVALGADEVTSFSDQHPRAYLYRPGFSGRKHVLDQLELHLDRLKQQCGCRALLSGKSGAGKTRIALEVARLAAYKNLTVITGECLPLEGSAHGSEVRGALLHPLRPLLQAIADHCHQQGSQVTEQLLGRRRKTLSLYEPAFTELPDDGLTPDPPRLPPPAARLRLFRDLAETITAFVQSNPLLLILDDLQWADELTLGFLAFLHADFFASTPVFVLGTCRSDEVSDPLRDILDAPDVVLLQLDRMDDRSIATIAADMLSLHDPPEALVRFLISHAEGNPFFVAEYLRAAVAERILDRKSMGGWDFVEGKESIDAALALPEALKSLIERRLLHLTQDARHLVDIAAVLGREFDGAPLLCMVDIDSNAALVAQKELLRRQILEEVAGGRFRFAHDKLREIAYDAIPIDKRRSLHRAAAMVIEERASDDESFPLLYSTLAHHFAIAEVDIKTFEYMEKAAEHALRSGAHSEAANLFLRAIALAQLRSTTSKAPSHTVDTRRHARWERMLGEALMGLGDLRSASDHTASALTALGLALPASRAKWVQHLVVELAKQIGHLTLPNLLRVSDDPLQDRAEAVSGAAQMAQVFYYAGNALSFAGMSLLAVNLAERTHCTADVARSYAHLGYLAGLARLSSLAQNYFHRARTLGHAAADPSAIAFSFYAEAAYHLGRCAWEQVDQTADPALKLVTDIGDRQEAEIVETILAHKAYFQGHFEQARRHFTTILDSARARSNIQHEAWGLYGIARSLIPLGRFQQAIQLLLAARTLLLKQLDRASLIICDGLLATAYLHSGDLEQASQTAQTLALAIEDTLPAVFSTVHGYAALAEVRLACWEQAHRAPAIEAIRRDAGRACKDLARFALVFPLALPTSLRMNGKLAYLSGRSRRAIALLDRAVYTAHHAAMRYEEALSHAALTGCTGLSNARRRSHEDKCASLCALLGIPCLVS